MPAPAGAGGPRVLLVCGELRPGLDGVADYVVRLAAALRDRGAIVRILHTSRSAGVVGGHSVGARWGLPALLRARRAVRGADAVHVQFAPSMYRFRGGIGLLPLVLGGTPLVTTLHEYGWWRIERRLPERLWRVLEGRGLADRETGMLVPRSSAVATTNGGHSAAVAARFRRRVPTTTVPIGANVEVAADVEKASARTGVREELGLAPDAVVLAFFGFVHPVKGVRYLAESVAALAEEGRDVHLLVIGGFESMALPADEAAVFEAELRRLIESSGADDRVRITGFLPPDAVSRLLLASDAAVLPFTAGVTAKSGSLLTVLAHGLPTVVTGGPDQDPDLVDGDRVVVVEAVRDAAALTSGVRRVLDDPASAGAIAGRGAAWAAEHDWDRIAEQHLALYRRAAR